MGLDETNLNNTNFTGAIFHKQNEIESKIAQFYDDRIHRINRRRISRINKTPVQVDYSVYFYNTDLTGVTGLDPDILENSFAKRNYRDDSYTFNRTGG